MREAFKNGLRYDAHGCPDLRNFDFQGYAESARRLRNRALRLFLWLAARAIRRRVAKLGALIAASRTPGNSALRTEKIVVDRKDNGDERKCCAR